MIWKLFCLFVTSDCLLAANEICLDFNLPSKLLFPFIRENWGILTDFYPTVSDSIVQERHFFSCCKNLTVGPLDKCSSRASEQRPDSSILVSKPTESGQDQTCISLLPSTTISSLPTEFFLTKIVKNILMHYCFKMAPAAKQQKKLMEQQEGKLKTNLYMAGPTKKYDYIFLWHYFGSKWSPVHYFDDRPMPLMVI